MALSPTTIKYIAIAVVVVVLVMLISALLWDLLKIVVGVLVAGALIYLGFRMILGKGLPKGIKSAVEKAVRSDEGESEK
jgi:hypothetical protein